TVAHGFPYRPNCLAFDPKLGLLATGTRSGLLRVYGKPGVELEAKLDSEIEIRQIVFVENRGQLVTLCEDSTIQLWEVNPKSDENGHSFTLLEKVKACDSFSKEHREGDLKQVTTISIDSKKSILLVGTRGGNIYILDLTTLELTDQIIYQDVVLQNIPDEHKKSNPGEVEIISEQPNVEGKFLIGYNKGLKVLWDNNTLAAEHFYIGNQQLESLCWLRNGQQFMSSHNDGSYVVWKVDDNIQPSEPPKFPYGPFPCKPIRKIIWKTVRNNDDFIVFSGGMPRTTFGDKNTVSVIQGTPERGKHIAFDFTSKIIDFLIIDGDDDEEFDNPKALLVLAEEEIVAIDLRNEDWLQFHLPYMWSVHSSPITNCQYYAEVPEELFDKIFEAGKRQTVGKYSMGEWPIFGGERVITDFTESKDLLITGHEDGSVRFWSVGNVNLEHIYTLHTSKLFHSLDDGITHIDVDEVPITEEESDWPPFRKVGAYDPFSDDVRLAIRKVILCPLNNILVVAGTAGQVIVFGLKDEDSEEPLNVYFANIVSEGDGFAWKGHERLNPAHGVLKLEAGFQPRSLLQLSPPAAVTALALHSNIALMAAGTSHGFVLFDYVQNKVVISKCTLTNVDMNASSGGDALISRRKSFRKSLRESFRKLRKGRSQQEKQSEKRSASPLSASSSSSPVKSGEASPKPSSSTGDDVVVEAKIEKVDKKTVERQVEARSTEDGMVSIVRCLYFATVCITNTGNVQTPTLWVGTNAGLVLVFAITVPSEDKRDSALVTCQLAKEIQLKHKAPVIFIQIVDTSGNPLPDVYEESSGKVKTFASTVPCRVLICSEEQFKLFTLPTLKPHCKAKLTAQEGSRARRIAIGKFIAKSDEKHIEHCLLCLSNQGDITIYTLNDLKRQLQATCTKKENINGISSLTFSRNAEGMYLQSPCEFRRFSLSARRCPRFFCEIALPEGSRLVKETPLAALTIENENADQKKEVASNDNVEEATAVCEENKNQEAPKPDKREDTTSDDANEKEENSTKKPVPIVNGTVEHEEEVSQILNESHISTVSNSSSINVTIDSVKEHMISHLSENSVITEATIKRTLISSPPETKPIINSHED
ncbi:Lethal(2) giant larvae-like protein, partial [Dinothrombium tinctorium]